MILLVYHAYFVVKSTVSRVLNGFWNPGHVTNYCVAMSPEQLMNYLNNGLE